MTLGVSGPRWIPLCSSRCLWWVRSRFCSPAPCRRTSPTRCPIPPGRQWWRRPPRPTPMTSSVRWQKAMTRVQGLYCLLVLKAGEPEEEGVYCSLCSFERCKCVSGEEEDMREGGTWERSICPLDWVYTVVLVVIVSSINVVNSFVRVNSILILLIGT